MGVLAQKDVCIPKFLEMHSSELNEIYEEQYFGYLSINREKRSEYRRLSVP